jgi:CRP/FNR family transcriptional regulator, cyclic AMP receptor protein
MHTLANFPFFKDAADLDFTRFDRRCTWRRYSREEIVVDYEDESSDVYFIISGEVRVLIRTAAGKEFIFGEIKAGQFFGEMAAIDGAKHSANVTALTKSEVCIMPASVFREIIFSSRVISERVLRHLMGRVRELTAHVTEHSIFDLKHRLYAELLRMHAIARNGGPTRNNAAAVASRSSRTDWLPPRAGDTRIVGTGRRGIDRKNPGRAYPFAVACPGRAPRRNHARGRAFFVRVKS